jgi:hypothetical protein
MKPKLIGGLAIGCLFVLALVTVWLRHQRELARRYDCLSVLRSTCFLLNMYRQDHDGELPVDFGALSNYTSSRLFVFGSGRAAGSWTNIAEWMDYFYIRWPSVTGLYTNYPLMYDRRLSNHGGKGINVLLVEGLVGSAIVGKPETFRGQFFWDEDAKWLRAFARDHPEAHIPLPEGLK